MKKIMTTLMSGLAAVLLFSGSATALDYDFNGTFRQDNDVIRLNFTVGSDSTVTVFSSSWVSGGFDPILAIWSSAGIKMAQQDDGLNTGSTLSNGISYNHGEWDSYYSVFLSAGSYIATVAQYNNFSVSDNLADGFRQDGNPNFTYDLNYGGATQPMFNGVWDNNDPRTANWAFHLLNVDTASVTPNNPVPEPSTLILLGVGLVGLGFTRRRFGKK